jgi:hypothetical protein
MQRSISGEVWFMATNGQDGNPEAWQALYSAALQELNVDKLPQTNSGRTERNCG